MTYCSYHAKNPAVVQCNQCARWLCPACDHRVRGFPFCQDCIVAGVELLRHSSSNSPTDILRRKSSPFIATLLSFVPGLGAAYNGQTSKAVLSPDAEDDVIARRLYGNPFAWGTTLIIIGTLFLLHTLLNVTLPIKELLPVALVALGAYMVFDYIRRGKASDRIVRFDSRRPPPSVVASTRPVDTANFRTGETTQFARRDVTPLPFERRS